MYVEAFIPHGPYDTPSGDAQTNMTYDNRARLYMPVLGRFGQEDPLGYVDGMNAVVSRRSAPTVYIDFNGAQADKDRAFGGSPYDNRWRVPDAPTVAASVDEIIDERLDDVQERLQRTSIPSSIQCGIVFSCSFIFIGVGRIKDNENDYKRGGSCVALPTNGGRGVIRQLRLASYWTGLR